jgi:hypothetical protein
MKNCEYNNFVDLMKKISRHFPKNEIDISLIKSYFNELKKYKFISIERGIDYLIATRIYPTLPIIGEITEAIKMSKHRIIKNK